MRCEIGAFSIRVRIADKAKRCNNFQVALGTARGLVECGLAWIGGGCGRSLRAYNRKRQKRGSIGTKPECLLESVHRCRGTTSYCGLGSKAKQIMVGDGKWAGKVPQMLRATYGPHGSYVWAEEWRWLENRERGPTGGAPAGRGRRAGLPS